jgi:hypothetical protein
MAIPGKERQGDLFFEREKGSEGGRGGLDVAGEAVNLFSCSLLISHREAKEHLK